MALTEEQIAALSNLGVAQEQIDMLKGENQDLGVIRQGPGPQMRGNGRIMQAANPLEHIGSMAQKYRAGKQMQGNRGQIGDLQTQQQQTRADMMRALMAQGNSPQPPTPPQPPRPGMMPMGIPDEGAVRGY